MKRLIFYIIIFFVFGEKIFSQDIIPSTKLNFSIFQKTNYVSAPSVSFDGKYLIFCALYNDNYTFFECTKQGDNWSEPVELLDFNNYLGAKTYKNAPVYNFDATKIYFEALNGTNNDIYVSNRTNSGWSKPELLSGFVNTLANEGEPSVSPDDNKLFFVRFTDDKDKNCATIYYSLKNNKLQWDSAFALISPLNLGCERSPRILSDNKTLIFATKRDEDKNFQLYYTKNLYNDIWYMPKQIGKFSNSDNLYATTDFESKIIYFSSVQNSRNAEILYTILPNEFKPENVTLVSGIISDENNIPLKANISLLDPVTLSLYGNFENNSITGEYKIFTPLDSKFILDFSSPDFSHYFHNYENTNKTVSFDTINALLFKHVALNLKIYDKDIFEPLDVEFSITDENNTNYFGIIPKKVNTGWYILNLPIGKKYTITLSSEYTEPYSFEVDLSRNVIFNEIEKNIEIESEKAEFIFNIFDDQTNVPVDCDVVLVNLSTNQRITSVVKTDENGNAIIFVRKGDYYDITINPHGYAFYNMQLSVTDTTTKTNIQVKLQPLKQNIKIELNNITFETNSADLKEESYQELNKVVDLLKNNPQIKVEISAHTDDVGSDSYNLKLSDKRAKSVVDYLIVHEIPFDRLISKGYGETQPLVPNTSDLNRSTNRRVELKIIEVMQ